MSRRARFEAEERRRQEEFKANRGIREKQYRTDLAIGLGNLGIRAGSLYQNYQKDKAERPLRKEQTKGIRLDNELRQRKLNELTQQKEWLNKSFPLEEAFADVRRETGGGYFDRNLLPYIKTRYANENPETGELSISRGKLIEMDKDLKANPNLVADIELHKIINSQEKMAKYREILKNPLKYARSTRAGEDGAQIEIPESEMRASHKKLQSMYMDEGKRLNRHMMKMGVRDSKTAKLLRERWVRINVNRFNMTEDNLDKFLLNSGINESQFPLFKQTYYDIQGEIKKAKAESAVQDSKRKEALYAGSFADFSRRGVEGKSPEYTPEELKRLPEYSKGLLKPAETAVEKGRERKSKEKIAEIRAEGRQEKADKNIKEYRRRWNKDSDGYLNKLIARMSKEGVPSKEIRKFREKVILKRSKYRNDGDDYDVGTMQAIKEILDETPPEEKSTGWGALFRQVFGESEINNIQSRKYGSIETSKEPPVTPETAIPDRSADNIEFTARKHGITTDEVRRRLGIQ